MGEDHTLRAEPFIFPSTEVRDGGCLFSLFNCGSIWPKNGQSPTRQKGTSQGQAKVKAPSRLRLMCSRAWHKKNRQEVLAEGICFRTSETARLEPSLAHSGSLLLMNIQ